MNSLGTHRYIGISPSVGTHYIMCSNKTRKLSSQTISLRTGVLPESGSAGTHCKKPVGVGTYCVQGLIISTPRSTDLQYKPPQLRMYQLT
jgi:hypothetical protein